MTRRRWRITLLAALATLAAVYPITSLFLSQDWVPQAVVTVAIAAGTGLVVRGLVRSRLLVVLAQLVVVAEVLLLRYAGDTFVAFVPTPASIGVANELGLQALDTIQRYSAPAPLNDGVTFWLLVIVGAVAICVDAMAATWRSPAAAGLPLLTAYLITAANGQSALELRYFVVPVALWLVMLHLTARAGFSRWGTASAAEHSEVDEATHDRDALRSFSLGALRLGAIGVVLALLLPVVVPHFPPRYLTEGLGRSESSGGDGSVGFNDTLDLTRSLNDQDQTPVLRYTTNAFTKSPLRVLATSYYSRGQWLQAGGGTQQGAPQPLPPPSQRRDYVINVTENTLAAPRIAVPYPVVAVAMQGTPWTIDPVTRDVRVGRAVSSYRVTYADLAPSPPQLRESGAPDSPDVTEDDYTLPDTIRPMLESWSAEVTRGADNPLDRAIAIQNHLRGSEYTYSLDLGPQLRDETGGLMDPIRMFRETKRGYCVQFATAMIMLARAQGIPARMAIGFLPGDPSGTDSYVVKASDAHAWPELYFQGYGWLRFEPTPGARTGSPPPYTVVGADAGATGGGRSVTESGASGSATTSARSTTTAAPTVAPAEPTVLDTVSSAFTWRNLVVLLTLLVVVLAVLIMPITAWLLRQRRRRAAVSQQDLVEADWEELTSHLGDLGLPSVEGATLRQLRERYVRDGHLDEESSSAMGRVTATLEKTRYDRPERTSPQEAIRLHHDIQTIRRQVGGTRAWQTRVRSFLWPRTGVSFWREVPARVRRLVGRR